MPVFRWCSYQTFPSSSFSILDLLLRQNIFNKCAKNLTIIANSYGFFCTAYEKATKEQRMRTEISQAKREANFYIQNVEKGKSIEAMETRKRKRADQVGHVIFTLHLYSFDFVMAKGFKTRCETRPSGTGQNPQGSICLEGISYLSGDDKPELFFFL